MRCKTSDDGTWSLTCLLCSWHEVVRPNTANKSDPYAALAHSWIHHARTWHFPEVDDIESLYAVVHEHCTLIRANRDDGRQYNQPRGLGKKLDDETRFAIAEDYRKGEMPVERIREKYGISSDVIRDVRIQFSIPSRRDMAAEARQARTRIIRIMLDSGVSKKDISERLEIGMDIVHEVDAMRKVK